MGKKKNKLKDVQSLVSDNKVLLAAIGGVALGVTLASILGIDKAKKIVETIGNSASNLTNKLKEKITGNHDSDKFPEDEAIKSWKTSKAEKELV